MVKFDAAIFFDNDQGYLDDVKAKCPNITLVKVNDTESTVKYSYKTNFYTKNNMTFSHKVLTPGPLKNLMDSLYEEYNEHSNIKLNNGYVSYLKHFKIIPKYHPESGIQQDDIDKYYEWKRTTTGNRILLLDWDQTLSQFDGIEFPGQSTLQMFFKNAPRQNLLHNLFIKPKDIAIFYLGGQERYTMITEWLKEVAQSGVHIAVLTNNGGARDILFQQVIDEIIPNGSYEIIASRFPPSNGDKGKALFMDTRFSSFCPKTGGRRRRTRKGVKTEYRKSRKHRR